MGQALRLEVILLSKEKAAAPRPKPRGRPRGRSCGRPCEAGLEAGLKAGLEAGLEAQGGKPSKTFQTLNPLQNPPNTFPNRHPRAKATSQSGPPGPRPQQWLSIRFQSCRLPARKPSKPLQTLQTPSKTSKPSRPGGMLGAGGPRAMARKESSPTQQNHIAPREARTPRP